MATLAIKGHSKRGSEVIERLEMLGGKNIHRIDAIRDYYVYFVIDDKNKTISSLKLNQVLPEQFIIYSLEEFEEKFPYKIGDKVYNIIHNENQTITKIAWSFQENEVVYQTNNNEYVFVNYIQPYKEETMEQRQYKELRMPLDDDDKLATEVTIDGNKILPPNGYLIGKITQVDNGMLVEYVKQKPQYPKTYEECAQILLERASVRNNIGYKGYLLIALQQLLVCRDAYWKIAGDWKPNWNTEEGKYTIFTSRDIVVRHKGWSSSYILAFPTEEIRDAFYENFKELIETCKELL